MNQSSPTKTEKTSGLSSSKNKPASSSSDIYRVPNRIKAIPRRVNGRREDN